MLWEAKNLWQTGLATERKYRLFAVACSRRIWHLFSDDLWRCAVEVSEGYADGLATEAELEATGEEIEASFDQDGLSEAQRWVRGIAAGHVFDRSYRLAGQVSGECLRALGQRHEGPEEQAQCDIIRDMFPNPFRPVSFSPEWRTDTAIAVARQMYESREFGAMPILADALQDAGCDNEDILSHCRGPGPHVRGCWVIDLVLSKE